MHFYIILLVIQAILFAIIEFFIIRPYEEIAHLSYVSSSKNNKIVSKITHKLKFKPWWLTPGPYGQSLFFGLTKKHKYDRREIFTHKDGVQVYLDWFEPREICDTTPIVFVCHGIAGDSTCGHSLRAAEAIRAKGWRCIVHNRRGHQSASLISSFDHIPSKGYPTYVDLEDMAEVVKYVVSCTPKAKRFIIGSSGGGNILTHYMSIDSTSFIAGVSSSDAYNLVELSKFYNSTHKIANGLLTVIMLNLFNKRIECVKRILESPRNCIQLNIEKINKTTNLLELDENTVLEFHKDKYKNIRDYLEASSSYKALSMIKTPLLLINAIDDPFIHCSLYKYALEASQQNENIISVITKQGGHTGWITNKISWDIALALSYFDSF